MDGEDWQATVHGVAKSQLSEFTFTFNQNYLDIWISGPDSSVITSFLLLNFSVLKLQWHISKVSNYYMKPFIMYLSGIVNSFIYLFFQIFSLFIYLFIIIIFYCTILYWFCHTSTCICQGCTRVPHPEPPSHRPPLTIPLGHLSAPAPIFLYPALNLDWRFISYMILYMF